MVVSIAQQKTFACVRLIRCTDLQSGYNLTSEHRIARRGENCEVQAAAGFLSRLDVELDNQPWIMSQLKIQDFP